MSLARLIAICVTGLLLAAAQPAGALTTEQVLKLRQAGVSDATIQMLIDHEMRTAGAGPGRYVVKPGRSGESIVFQAGSAGSGETALPLTPQQAADPNLRAILGTQPSADIVVREETPQVSQALPFSQGRTVVVPRTKITTGAGTAGAGVTGQGGYTLLLESHRNQAGAQRRAQDLSAQGVEAKVESVDLGDKGTWHRVVHGHFVDRAAAQAQGDQLKRLGGVEHYTILSR
ncbi:MAG: SPOR domain-containing protein [Pseudomonadota bacterium]